MMKCTTFSDTCVTHNKARFSRMPFNTLCLKVDCGSMSMYNSVYTCVYTASSAWRARLCVGCWYARRLSQSHSFWLLLVDFSLVLINCFPREHSGRTKMAQVELKANRVCDALRPSGFLLVPQSDTVAQWHWPRQKITRVLSLHT